MDALDRYDLDGRSIHVVLAKNKRKSSDEMRRREDRNGGGGRRRSRRNSSVSRSRSPERRTTNDREEKVRLICHPFPSYFSIISLSIILFYKFLL